MTDGPHVPLERATVAIIGLGLMGSSLGLALDGRCARRVGADADDLTARAALDRRAIDDLGDPSEAARQADVVVLCMPVADIVASARAVAPHMRPASVLTDVGSTMATICDVYDSLPVASIGGHPMCGRERSGPAAADPRLFQDAPWVLARTARTTPAARQLVGELVAATGARTVDLERHEHDRRVAYVSHLPYLVAQGLAGAPDDLALELAATGFAGATRMARGSVPMWRDVLATNADQLRAALAALRQELDGLEELLDDAAALEGRLHAGRSRLARLRQA